MNQPDAHLRALRQGRESAVALYRYLADGHAPAVLRSSTMIGGEPVHLDTTFLYSRFYGTKASHTPTPWFAFGPVQVLALSYAASALVDRLARDRATMLASPQWRDATMARTFLTPTRTRCIAFGRTLDFPHEQLVDYSVHEPGSACLFVFRDSPALQLQGPPAWYHAVLLAYLTFGPRDWTGAAFLRPLRAEVERLSSQRQAPLPADVDPTDDRAGGTPGAPA